MTRRQLLHAAALPALAAPVVRLPRKVRVGSIGIEGHLDQLTSALPSLPDVEFVAHTAPARKFENAHYTDYRQMLDRERLDVVVVANDDGARAAAVIECLTRKLHVYSEKPLAKHRRDYDKIKRMVLAGPMKLGLMLNYRYDPPFLALRAIVDSGEIGEVAQIQAQKSYRPGLDTAWRNRDESFSGTIPWVGIHGIDYMLFASRRRFVECSAFQTRVGFPAMGPRANSAGVLFKMDNGGVATLAIDYLRPEASDIHNDERLRLAGTKGIAEYQAATGVTVLSGKSMRRVETLPPKGTIFADYLASVYAGAKPTLSHDEIWAASEAAYCAREAAETGRLVKIG